MVSQSTERTHVLINFLLSYGKKNISFFKRSKRPKHRESYLTSPLKFAEYEFTSDASVLKGFHQTHRHTNISVAD